jgi:hypothetical protein
MLLLSVYGLIVKYTVKFYISYNYFNKLKNIYYCFYYLTANISKIKAKFIT